MIEATRELLADAAESIRRLQPTVAAATDPSQYSGPREPLRLLGYASNGVADELALAMLAHVLDDLPIVVEITGTRLMASQLVSLVQERGVSVICLADLPPSPSSKTRYLVKRLRAAFPELRILVGPLGAAGAGGRQHADLTRRRCESCGLDAGADARVRRRPRRASAHPRAGRRGTASPSARDRERQAESGDAAVLL